MSNSIYISARDAIVERDGVSREEAQATVAEAVNRTMEEAAQGNYQIAEDVWMEETGLEMDYFPFF